MTSPGARARASECSGSRAMVPAAERRLPQKQECDLNSRCQHRILVDLADGIDQK